jgi:hypothetical protein
MGGGGGGTAALAGLLVTPNAQVALNSTSTPHSMTSTTPGLQPADEFPPDLDDDSSQYTRLLEIGNLNTKSIHLFITNP